MSPNNQEVDRINEHKFLAELGRLLTFMYEEDRQTALGMYTRMFEETADEQGLLQLLVSPTRQAVVLARTYDAKERKLQVQTQHREEDIYADADNVPAFIFAIDKIAKQAEELGVKQPAVSEGQFSIFEAAEEEAAAEVPAVEAEKAPEEAVEKAAEAPAADEPAAETEAEADSSIDETADALDAFLKDFSVENGELVSTKAGEAETEPEAEAPADAGEDAPAATEKAESPVENLLEKPVETKKQTNILLLILYIFISIPVGIAGIALLLIPTALFLVLAAGCASLGIALIGTCFGSFAVIADTMVVFGVSILLLALGLLFIWSFIWMLGGVIVGFIRLLCRLGAKLCIKEVADQ